jgi:hypothetical protein
MAHRSDQGKFRPGHEVEIGGTQLERDANKGRTSLRIRDIVVRDADGTVVASAPKAEVGISGASLFLGRIRAERLSLVGAEWRCGSSRTARLRFSRAATSARWSPPRQFRRLLFRR